LFHMELACLGGGRECGEGDEEEKATKEILL
jgi:hypothetical protein